ncbi:MAG: hypothetical protein RI956_1009, partial [Pseudomonadota bacterium]
MTETKKPRRNKLKKYSEGEIALTFHLDKIKPNTALMNHWLNTDCSLNHVETELFKSVIEEAKNNIEAWNEEELKMNFISPILRISHITSSKTIRTFYERTIEAEVEGIYLKTKTDFMIAKGLLDVMQNPYFHFQEYKKDKDPNGDPLGQLLEAFLIAQAINKNDKPMYGAYIVGRYWYFVTMEAKEYCVSPSYDSTKEAELMQIIAVLRHFKVI